MAFDNPVLLTIALCEIGFWALVLGGLTARYVLRARSVSSLLLASLPVLDVILIVAVAIDLHRGGDVGFAHRLAGIYLGWTVAFAPSTITWLDVRFAHRFAGGPEPTTHPKKGPIAYRREMALFRRWLAAAAIALAVTFGLAFTVASAEQADALTEVVPTIALITVVWFVTGPVWVKASRVGDGFVR